MSSLWVSHSSDSTGQLIALEKVVKIRTFKQIKDGRLLYRMVFETDMAASSTTTWDFAKKEQALETIARIVSLIDSTALKDRLHESVIYIDLARGFE